ncbi:tryptophan halogenase family protein [Niveispirillum sp. KHB5.9]|uniref:tryptophan halogenase family protein n=1 Tax=Niveispirillum sp. KHB5.9 TaxID=3400269 RepID=UPI003A8BE13F
MSDRRIRRITIVGGGTAGWMSAATLARVLGPDYAEITVVESDEIGTVGVGEATIPQMATFNRMLGIDEDEFLRATRGSIKLGIQFVNWGKLGHTYFHPFGHIGVNMEGVSFHAFWLRLKHLGLVDRIEDWSLQSTAGARGKFMRAINAGRSPLSEIAYAFHFDASLYARYLRQYAEARGVVRREGRIVRVHQHPETGFINSVELADGGQVGGELFIDCSGFRGLLIEDTLKAGFTDWSHHLPCDRAVAVPCEGIEGIEPYTRATAHKAGWQWRIPLQHRIGNGHVFCSQYISDDEAISVLLSNLDGKPTADPRILRFKAGHRKQVWIKNCVSIGLASGFLEPLESTSIWLIQSGLSRLMAMFPDRDFDPATIARYNRILTTEYTEIRDFIILHYKATQRTDSPFWDYCREMPVPERLAEKMAVFMDHGRTFRENEELFNDTSWFAVMLGQLMMPKGYDPVADVLSLEETKARLAQIKDAVSNSADYMPTHREFLRQNCRAD